MIKLMKNNDNLRILVIHDDTPDVQSYTTVLFEKILPILINSCILLFFDLNFESPSRCPLKIILDFNTSEYIPLEISLKNFL